MVEDEAARCTDAEYIFLIINSTSFSSITTTGFGHAMSPTVFCCLTVDFDRRDVGRRMISLASNHLAIITHKTIGANDIASSISTKISLRRALNKDEIMFSDKYP